MSAQETQAAGSSFYAGMRVLPKAERQAMFAVYGFCRQVDDIADDLQGERAQRRARSPCRSSAMSSTWRQKP